MRLKFAALSIVTALCGVAESNSRAVRTPSSWFRCCLWIDHTRPPTVHFATSFMNRSSLRSRNLASPDSGLIRRPRSFDLQIG
jgi:hypothetical protein